MFLQVEFIEIMWDVCVCFPDGIYYATNSYVPINNIK